MTPEAREGTMGDTPEPVHGYVGGLPAMCPVKELTGRFCHKCEPHPEELRADSFNTREIERRLRAKLEPLLDDLEGLGASWEMVANSERLQGEIAAKKADIVSTLAREVAAMLAEETQCQTCEAREREAVFKELVLFSPYTSD
jgi:hypothetical protein